MAAIEAKEMFKHEFMRRYEMWMQDRFDLTDHDYGWKYGWQKSEKLMNLKDSLAAVVMFQKYIYPMRDVDKIEKEIGVSKKDVWELCKEKWLSSVQRQWNMFYFVSQKTAKEIWKEEKTRKEVKL